MPREYTDEEYEVLDVAGGGFIQRAFKDISKASVAKQLTVGAASGWCSGYLCGKVGKAAAAALGGSLLLLQIAHHQGYITVDMGKLQRDLKKYKRKLQAETDNAIPAVRDFVAENVFLAGGFAAGFLLGMAT